MFRGAFSIVFALSLLFSSQTYSVDQLVTLPHFCQDLLTKNKAYSLYSRIPGFNWIANGFPWASTPVQRALDESDAYIWNLSRYHGWIETGILEVLDRNGVVRVKKSVKGTYCRIPFSAFKEAFNWVMGAVDRIKLKPKDFAMFRIRHTHPGYHPDPFVEATMHSFSKGDRNATRAIRDHFYSFPELKHVVVESQILYRDEDRVFRKKAYLLLPKKMK